MKKLLYIILLFIYFYVPVWAVDETVLKAGVSMSNKVPSDFFGTWKVTSSIRDTNNRNMFNEVTTDFWNISKVDNVIILTNPISGAKANLTIQDVQNNQIKFTHVSKNKSAQMVETPILTLNGENFYGTDKIVIEKYKNGIKISEDYVVYDLSAEKISGSSLGSLFKVK